ncbi:F-box domain-containing protein [Favolaschia claudopus]|uniref:F-box domain-containing protein n=1 Tax=Favolaschia claudopus TaxID=2862362 RepID=A0AAW0DH73_9AGAR
MLQALESDRVLVAKTDAQIRKIEAEISQLEDAEQVRALKDSIPVLHSSKNPAQQRLDLYKYPVLTLPNEIISDIFVHFLPTYPEPPPYFGELSPTTLTHICRQWREIALTTPALWRAIDLRGFTGELASLAPQWLERSGCLPLSIRAAESELDYYDDFPSISGILIPHRARWEQLDLNLDRPEHLEVLDGPLPLLRTLSVYLGDRLENPLLLQTVPLLRTVVLDDYGQPSLILPWAQLTSLTLRCIYPAECVSILRQTQNLVNCDVKIWAAQLPTGRLADLTLSRLETLVFERNSDGVWSDFTQLLIAPALRSLKIREDLLGQPDPIASLNSFVLKSGCTLNELRIIRASIDEAVYRKGFPSIPLVHVSLVGR